jgi:hypothetical protein
MDNLKWVELATAAERTGRDNITRVYRAKNHFVATDGHRMHMSNGLPDAQPGYLDGHDGQFPDYEQILKQVNSTCVITIASAPDVNEFARKLKAFLPLAKIMAATAPVVTVMVVKDTLQIGLPDADNLQAHFDTAAENKGTLRNRIGVRLDYLLDALAWADKTNRQALTIEFSGELGPIRIKSGDDVLTAIVMPCRL